MRCADIAVLLISVVISCAASSLPDGCPTILSKQDWGAQTAKQVEYTIVPTEYVVFHHTVTPACYTRTTCTNRVKNTQHYHMNDLQFNDIGYNFLIGGDGNIYEGAGWHKRGAHTFGYNYRSLGIGFIGNFVNELPDPQQLQAAKDFLKCGVELGELDKDYKLIGGKQVHSTESPGSRFMKEIQTWPHFERNPK